MIQIIDLHKSYGSKEVLKGISYDFEPGLVHGIVGENGAGKTTFFKCIAGLERFEGDIKSNVYPIKNHLGLLETNPQFMSKITGWEYLKLICSARKIQVDNFIEQNVFDLPLDEYAENYSTGMKKKLALTGLLLQNNNLFILDEPFNGVDIHSNILINEIINKLKQASKTLLISSHIFSTLSDSCDEIHLLKEGRFIQHAKKDSFDALNKQMQQFVIGDKLDKLLIK